MVGKRFIQIAIISVSTFLTFACSSAMSIAILAMIDKDSDLENNWTTRHISLILNVDSAVMSLLVLPGNYLSKFFKPANVISLSLFGSGLSFFCIPIVSPIGWWSVFIIRILGGIFRASEFSFIINIISKWAPINERTRMSIIAICTNSLGNMGGTLLSSVIATTFGWKYIFFIFGPIMCVWSIIVSMLLVDSPANHPTISDKEKSLYDIPKEMDNEKRFYKPPWLKMLTSPAIWAINTSYIAVHFSLMLLITQLPLFFSRVLKFEMAQIGFLTTLPFLITFTTSLVFGWIADYFIARKVSISIVRRIFNSIGLWGQAAILVLLSYTDADKSSLIIVLILLEAMLSAGVYSGARANTLDISPNFTGATKSLAHFIASPFSALLPLIWSKLVKDVNDMNQWQNSFLLTAIVLFIANIIFIMFAKGKPQDWDCPNKKENTSKLPS